MNASEFDTRLERVRRASDVVSSLPEKLQADAFYYLIGSAPLSFAETPAIPTVEEEGSLSGAQPPASSDGGSTSTRRARKNSAKPGKSVSNDPNIELFPDGKTSFKAFAAEKSPGSNDERYAVAVYWILRLAELDVATVAQVMSCFMVADWRLPSDAANAASQSRKAGFLSSAKSDDLKLSSIGVNLVKSDLPRAKAKS
ncbi:hypothetical protein ACFXQA_06450 [Microbacterium sp. P07]|uniref:hypothetical protein n=1 Tax=Microbacterium sp. P07 TaxID=3366952 RepID=UPI00374647BC